MRQNLYQRANALLHCILILKLSSPVLLLFVVRLCALAALPVAGIVGYGDYPHFLDLAQLAVDHGGGQPFIGHWVEFPPLFPFLWLGIYKLTGGTSHVYYYMLPLILLSFGQSLAVGFSFSRMLTSLLEWPLLLSRCRFDIIWRPIIIRTFLLVLLAAEFAKLAIGNPLAWLPGGEG